MFVESFVRRFYAALEKVGEALCVNPRRFHGLSLSGVEGFDSAAEAASGGEFADDGGGDGVTGFDDLGQNFIDGVFVKDAEIAVPLHIDLE